MSEPEPKPVEDDLAMATFIQITRIYDVLMSMYRADYPVQADRLAELHEQGDILTPPPAWNPTD